MKRNLFIGLVLFTLCLLQFPAWAQNPSLDYSVSKLFASTGGTGIIRVTSGSACGWKATSGVAWISITSGASGTGAGNVQYTVTANTGATRNGTITVEGHTYTITQSGTTGITTATAAATAH